MAHARFRKSGTLMVAALWAVWQASSSLGMQLSPQADVVKPTAEELKWQRIPWVTDLAQGQRLAQSERRPIFLWVTGDDPLERC